tara:strand:- start:565 stop:687 length:123 start_codon:yes stop_codon:yes gene_type:complete
MTQLGNITSMTKTGISNSCGIDQKKFNLLLKGNLASGDLK